jgi:hypothetical protein
MPARDNELAVNPSSVPVIANGNSAVKTIYGTPINGLALVVDVNATGVSTVPTLDVYVRASTSTAAPTTDSAIAGQRKGILTAGTYIVPFVAPNARAILVEYVVNGAATDTPNFSDVTAYITENVGGDWTRLSIPV